MSAPYEPMAIVSVLATIVQSIAALWTVIVAYDTTTLAARERVEDRLRQNNEACARLAAASLYAQEALDASSSLDHRGDRIIAVENAVRRLDSLATVFEGDFSALQAIRNLRFALVEFRAAISVGLFEVQEAAKAVKAGQSEIAAAIAARNPDKIVAAANRGLPFGIKLKWGKPRHHR